MFLNLLQERDGLTRAGGGEALRFFIWQRLAEIGVRGRLERGRILGLLKISPEITLSIHTCIIAFR